MSNNDFIPFCKTIFKAHDKGISYELCIEWIYINVISLIAIKIFKKNIKLRTENLYLGNFTIL